MPDSVFRINAPAVIFERFDDELVAIHLETGAYHSLIGAAADAFVLLGEEATVPELADALAMRYAATSAEIAPALGPFLEELGKEELIVPVGTRKPRGPLHLAGGETRLPFIPPNVQAYHDLESLFLLDPIHEVGDQGWPQPASDPLAK
jgi:Coenzyme PQQ synthesis protein D (PqqD)